MSRILTDDEAIATAALAGWRFVRSQSTTYPEIVVWDTYDKNGRYHGLNSVLANAARYALAVMESKDDSRDGRHGQWMRPSQATHIGNSRIFARRGKSADAPRL